MHRLDPARATLTVVGGPSDGEAFAIDPDPQSLGLQGWMICLGVQNDDRPVARVLFERGQYFVQDAAGRLPRRPLQPGGSVYILGCRLVLAIRSSVELDVEVDVAEPERIEPALLNPVEPEAAEELPGWTRRLAWIGPVVGVAIGGALLYFIF